MATAANRFAYAPPLENVQPTRGSFFKRLFEALKKSREEQARREIARHEYLFGAMDVTAPRDDKAK